MTTLHSLMQGWHKLYTLIHIYTYHYQPPHLPLTQNQDQVIYRIVYKGFFKFHSMSILFVYVSFIYHFCELTFSLSPVFSLSTTSSTFSNFITLYSLYYTYLPPPSTLPPLPLFSEKFPSPGSSVLPYKQCVFVSLGVQVYTPHCLFIYIIQLTLV